MMKDSGLNEAKQTPGGKRAQVLRKKVEVNKSKTVEQLISELQLKPSSVLVEINGEVFHPDRVKERTLKKGDTVVLLSLIVGG
jgi:thiamine biosynthesis protein ThiS